MPSEKISIDGSTCFRIGEVTGTREIAKILRDGGSSQTGRSRLIQASLVRDEKQGNSKSHRGYETGSHASLFTNGKKETLCRFKRFSFTSCPAPSPHDRFALCPFPTYSFTNSLQILQLQMNDYKYHYLFTTFVSINVKYQEDVMRKSCTKVYFFFLLSFTPSRSSFPRVRISRLSTSRISSTISSISLPSV